MKNLLLILGFILVNLYSAYSGDCDDVTCSEPWSLGETGWIQIQLNDDPEIYCVGKICYCYDLDTLELERANFWIKKIVWADTCYANHYNSIDYDVLKESIIVELIRIHQNQIPIRFCPNSWYPAELYTSFCFATALYYGDYVSLLCFGDGYCSQMYKYCWDNTVSPWKLNVQKEGQPYIYDTGTCNIPFVAGPNVTIIHDCLPWCE